MRNLLFVALLVTQTAFSAQPAQDDRKVLKYMKEVFWPDAYKTQNTKRLNRLLHDSFELVTADGERRSKSQELEDLPGFDWPHDDFTFTITRLDVYADEFAIVSGQGKASGTRQSEQYCFTYESSNVLIKQDSRWQAVLSHVSGISRECE